MRFAWFVALSAVSILALAGCYEAEVAEPVSVEGEAVQNEPDPGLLRLADLMTGRFSSEDQAGEDEAFFDIRLVMKRIWPDASEFVWLYVEQAAADSRDEPYRQRVYRLAHVGGDVYESRVYELPGEAQRFAGAWKQDDPLSELSPDDLVEREGCAVMLRARNDGTFAGSTLGSQCASTLRGATYATSEVKIDNEGLTSWDRGYNDAHEQVWGAEEGGYRFDKIEDF